MPPTNIVMSKPSKQQKSAELQRQHIERSHQFAAEWFAKHEATCLVPLERGERPTVIEWRKPSDSNYAMTFFIWRNRVIVTGDVGDAVYAWPCSELTIEQLATFDWHYFAGKCVASETWRDYTQKIPGVAAPVCNIRAIAHFVGLQMAIKQLSQKTAQPA